MKPNVFLLATCRKPELLPATLLVFDSIRVGFPTAKIGVQVNTTAGWHDEGGRLRQAAKEANANLYYDRPTTHHEWIEILIDRQHEPFFICDTDVIFWDDFEKFDFSGQTIAGRYTPQFYDEFTSCITKPRLHTSLMYIDPAKVRAEMESFYAQFPQGQPFNHMRPNLIEPRIFSQQVMSTSYFHDTCSQLYHSIGGEAFREEQLNCYDHLNCGTYSDLAGPSMTLARDIQATHQAIFANPQLAKGCYKKQDAYYAHFKA